MYVERTTMTMQPVDAYAVHPGSHATSATYPAPAAVAAVPTVEQAAPTAQQAPPLPEPTPAERAAITGPTGHLAPEGMPPWGFNVQPAELRRGERTRQPYEDGVGPVGKIPTSDEGPHVDVQA